MGKNYILIKKAKNEIAIRRASDIFTVTGVPPESPVPFNSAGLCPELRP